MAANQVTEMAIKSGAFEQREKLIDALIFSGLVLRIPHVGYQQLFFWDPNFFVDFAGIVLC